MKAGKKAAPGILLIVGTLLGAATLAWACSPAAGFATLTQAGPVGATFKAGVGAPGYKGPMEVRWNSLDGPVVSRPAAVQDGAAGFTMLDVTVPDVAPGVYYLVFPTKDSGVGRMAFEVTPSAASAGSGQMAPADLWSGFESTGSSDSGLSQESPPSSTGLGAGLGVLGAGTVLMSAFTVVALQRTRNRARTR